MLRGYAKGRAMTPYYPKYTLDDIATWRAMQHRVGKSATYNDFWKTHDTCPTCHGYKIEPTSNDKPCHSCGGTGHYFEKTTSYERVPDMANKHLENAIRQRQDRRFLEYIREVRQSDPKAFPSVVLPEDIKPSHDLEVMKSKIDALNNAISEAAHIADELPPNRQELAEALLDIRRVLNDALDSTEPKES